MIIASLYPCPFDSQERHESNSTIIYKNQIFSSEEAKLTTVKQDATSRFPERSLLLGCKHFNIQPKDIDHWVFPKTKLKISDTYLISFFSYFKVYFKSKNQFIRWKSKKLHFIDHHKMHIALSALSSKFKDTAYISADGGGDDGDHRNFVFGEFKNEKFYDKISHFGHESLASFHAYVSDSIGMSGGENGKTSGLSAYGNYNSELINKLSKLLITKNNSNIFFERKRYGKTKFNLKKVKPQDYDRGKIINTYPSKTNVFNITKKYLPQDISFAAEYLVSKKFIKVLKFIRTKTKLNNIVFSGGLFSNVSLNNKILESKIFKNVFFSVAPTDAGLSLGGAMYLYYKLTKKRFKDLNPYLGPNFNNNEIEEVINKFNLRYKKVKNVAKEGAKIISKGNVLGWFQGRAEIGHRALGNRSIIADPRRSEMKELVNQHLKKRDWFMPYAPAVLESDMHLFTDKKYVSNYMQIAFKIKNNLFKKIRSTIHIDNSARIQTVTKKNNYIFWKLINEFKRYSKIGAVMNTSFNRHGIATISSPRQAIEHLLEGCMDYLIISKYVISLKENRKLYKKKFLLLKDKKNLLDLCNNRYNSISNLLNKNQKKFYKNQIKKIKFNEK
tara:strand:+ start:4505 stop:6343 length:1839 start_codon:yes stop_codon:yes gene_type:complete